MAVKVLMTAIGQQIIADTKQVENKETKEVIGYWLSKARVVSYKLTEDDQVNVNFGTYCLVSNDDEFSLRADHVVAILTPREEVLERYDLIINPPAESGEEVSELNEAVLEDESEPTTAAVG